MSDSAITRWSMRKERAQACIDLHFAREAFTY